MAQGAAAPDAGASRPAGWTVTQISPVFGQVLRTTLPAVFRPAFEATRGDRYIRELVPEGDSVDRWTQMITVTGEKGMASKPDVSPKAFGESIAGNFRKACPMSFAALGFPDRSLDGREAFILVASCGSSPRSGGTTSESALIVVLRGDADFYTVQWAVRGERSDTPPAIDVAAWGARFKALTPIKLCPIEPPPYAACLAAK